MRAVGETRERAQRLHADEKVAEDFDVWTDLLSRRAAVLWVLKSVYVRVLEDRGLLSPGRLLDPESQQLFERIAPHLGETAFLRWVYRDLATSEGGLPELFSPQPAEVAFPSDELSRGLIEFWRHRDADTGAAWSFAEEKFEGELMGDLYQELDPVVKDRFALCQTPDFVRAFILDRTLTPAIEEFGAEDVRLLDPACGSGHFLIDGLKRLVVATAKKHTAWPRDKVVAHALDRVVGIDLNDYACALARTRLIMTAAELAGVTKLEDAGRFHPHVYWADGLEQVECEEEPAVVQTDLFTRAEARPRAALTRSDVRSALRKVFEKKFQAVVANPPYITEKDAARKEYHREKMGRGQRYVSAYREYSLGSPFTERCFQLAAKTGFVGLITSNNFMKREFGKPLIEKVLAGYDLTLVVDTSQAYIPFHGTPTVLLFGRNQRPSGDLVQVVMGKRGEPGTPDDPAKGKVWTSISDGWSQVGYQSEYVSVAGLARDTLSTHPWSLGGGGAAELKAELEAAAVKRLNELVSAVGAVSVIRADEAYEVPEGALQSGLPADVTLGHVVGQDVRDWIARPSSRVLFPYDRDATVREHPAVLQRLWPFRMLLRGRVAFGKTQLEHGLKWFEYSMLFAERFRGPLLIVFANVSTHAQFALLRERVVVNSKAPVIKLAAGSNEEDHLALLGFLNSSTACFWMKQVFHPKSHASQRHHPDPARGVYEFAATGLLACPVLSLGERLNDVIELARAIDECARARSNLLDPSYINSVIASSEGGHTIEAKLAARWFSADTLRERMVALQEELDWIVYVGFGLASLDCLVDSNRYADLTCPRGSRPFERKAGRTSTVRAGGRVLELDEGEVAPVGTLPEWVEKTWRRREVATAGSAKLQMLETPVFKRAWRDTEQNIAEPEYRRRKDASDLEKWFADCVERQGASRTSAFSLSQLVASLQDDRNVLAVAEVLAGRPDFSLEALVAHILATESVPEHRFHVYTEAGLAKRAAWEEAWMLQRREDAGEKVDSIPEAPEYSQGSRGKSTDFVRTEYWRLRGKLDVPKERFIAFTQVPGRSGVEILYGWAGWTAQQRVKVLLDIDAGLEDAAVSINDRIALLDSAWRLLPEVARDDVAAATRLRTELKALVGPEGPSRELLEEWRKRFPPSSSRAVGPKRGAKKPASPRIEDSEDEESDES
jgi:hypothetical protein